MEDHTKTIETMTELQRESLKKLAVNPGMDTFIFSGVQVALIDKGLITTFQQVTATGHEVAEALNAPGLAPYYDAEWEALPEDGEGSKNG